MADQSQIIRQLKKLPSILKKIRRQKQRIVLTQGSFDMVHIGHARYCVKAKSFGDVLFVGVDSDQKIRARKGPDRPVVPEDERLEMLTHLRSVDYVVLKPITQEKFLLVRTIRPDVLIVTEETYQRYTPKQVAELEELCGEVVVLEAQATTSTSAKIRLLQMGAAKKISNTLSKKLIGTIEEVLKELKGE